MKINKLFFVLLSLFIFSSFIMQNNVFAGECGCSGNKICTGTCTNDAIGPMEPVWFCDECSDPPGFTCNESDEEDCPCGSERICCSNGCEGTYVRCLTDCGGDDDDEGSSFSSSSSSSSAASCPASAPALTGAICTYNATTKGFDISWDRPDLVAAQIDPARFSVARYTMATWKGSAAENPNDYTNVYPTDNSKWSKYICVDHLIKSDRELYKIPNNGEDTINASTWPRNWPAPTQSWPGRCDWRLDTDNTTANPSTSTMSYRPAYGMGTYSGTIGYILSDNDPAFAGNKEHCKDGVPAQTNIPAASFTCTVPTDVTDNSPYKMTCDMAATNMIQQPNWNNERQYWLAIGNNYNNALTISGKMKGVGDVSINNLFGLTFWRSPADKNECNSGGCWYGSTKPGFISEPVFTKKTDPHIKSLTTDINLTNSSQIQPGRYYVVCNSTLDNLNTCSGNPLVSYPSGTFQNCGGTNSRVVLNIKCIGKDKGNADCDGTIDDNDYQMWKEKYLSGKYCDDNNATDFDGNNCSYLLDFEIWRKNQGVVFPTHMPPN